MKYIVSDCILVQIHTQTVPAGDVAVLNLPQKKEGERDRWSQRDQVQVCAHNYSAL